jgi:hypothetical protein
MDALSDNYMFKWLKKTALWIIAVPMLVFGLGAASNQLVLAVNKDRFPVMWNTYKVVNYEMELMKATQSEDPDVALKARFDLEALMQGGYLDDTHVVMTSKTHLNFLADWIDLGSIYSPGDMLLYLGEYGMGYSSVVWMVVVLGKLNRKEN